MEGKEGKEGVGGGAGGGRHGSEEETQMGEAVTTTFYAGWVGWLKGPALPAELKEPPWQLLCPQGYYRVQPCVCRSLQWGAWV